MCTSSSAGRLWRWATHHLHPMISSSVFSALTGHHYFYSLPTLHHDVFTNRARSSFIDEYFDDRSSLHRIYNVLLEQRRQSTKKCQVSFSSNRVAPSHSTAPNKSAAEICCLMSHPLFYRLHPTSPPAVTHQRSKSVA